MQRHLSIMGVGLLLLACTACDTQMTPEEREQARLAQEALNKELVQAVDSNNLKAAAILIDDGASPNALDSRSRSLLYKSCGQDSSALFDLLVENNVDPNIINFQGRSGGVRPSSLAKCLEDGHYDRAKTLIEIGADVNLSHRVQPNPLASAAQFMPKNGDQADVKAMSFLIEHGALVNYEPAGGLQDRPLAVAIERGSSEGIGFLFKHGANLSEAYPEDTIKSAIDGLLKGFLEPQDWDGFMHIFNSLESDEDRQTAIRTMTEEMAPPESDFFTTSKARRLMGQFRANLKALDTGSVATSTPLITIGNGTYECRDGGQLNRLTFNGKLFDYELLREGASVGTCSPQEYSYDGRQLWIDNPSCKMGGSPIPSRGTITYDIRMENKEMYLTSSNSGEIKCTKAG